MPRISLYSQITFTDALIIVLLAIGGFAGFSRFPSYSDIDSQIASLSYKVVWAVLLFVFNYLMVFRKIRDSYFDLQIAHLHAFLLNIVISAVMMIAFFFVILGFPGIEKIPNTLIAAQAGLATVYLVVHGWISFQPNIRELGDLSVEINKKIHDLKGRDRANVNHEEIRKTRALCQLYLEKVDTLAAEAWRNSSDQKKIFDHKNRIAKISEALGAPEPSVPEALRGLRENTS